MSEFKNKPLNTNVFKNTFKKSDNHPDYVGKSIEIPAAGTYDIALWVKEGRNGKYFSCALSEPFIKTESTQPQQSQTEEQPPVDDDLPF